MTKDSVYRLMIGLHCLTAVATGIAGGVMVARSYWPWAVMTGAMVVYYGSLKWWQFQIVYWDWRIDCAELRRERAEQEEAIQKQNEINRQNALSEVPEYYI